jgi:hypothetical protein
MKIGWNLFFIKMEKLHEISYWNREKKDSLSSQMRDLSWNKLVDIFKLEMFLNTKVKINILITWWDLKFREVINNWIQYQNVILDYLIFLRQNNLIIYLKFFIIFSTISMLLLNSVANGIGKWKIFKNLSNRQVFGKIMIWVFILFLPLFIPVFSQITKILLYKTK